MDGILRSAVNAVHAAFGDAAVDVVHEAWIGQNAMGEPQYAAPLPRKAVVYEGVVEARVPGGKVITTRARLSFVDLVEPNGAPDRQEPFDTRDLFTLPSGLKATGLEVPAGTLDPETGRPYARTVWLL